MDGPLIVELLLSAAGIAFNPPAVIAAIFLASSSRWRSLAFAGGWLVGLLLLGLAFVLAGDAGKLLGAPSTLSLVIKSVLGAALLVWALSKWRGRKASADTDETPGWMRSLGELSTPRAFLVAAAYAALNPKTIAFALAGSLAILEARDAVAAQLIALLLFTVIASLTVTVPVALPLVAPDRSASALDAARRWLTDNGAIVTAGVLGVLGVVLLYSGLTGLLPLGR